MSEKNIFGSNLRNRIILYLLGNFILAFGLVLIAKSNIGITPVNSIAYVFSRILDKDHGLMTTIVYSSYLLVQIVILRKEFHPVQLLQIVFSVIFGFFVSFWHSVLFFFTPEIYWTRLLLVVLSIFINAFGLLLYLKADLIPLPPDGLNLAIQKKTGWKLYKIKIAMDCVFLVIAAIISFCIARKNIGFREGTVFMLCIGQVMGVFSKHLGPKIDRLFKLEPGQV